MPEYIPTPFVGREAELSELHRALRSVIGNQQPGFVLIEGDFGVGKTALVEEFLAEVAKQNDSVLIGQAKCAMETECNGLIPFSQLFVNLTEKGLRRGVIIGSLFEFAKEVAPAWLDVFTMGTASNVVKGTIKTAEECGKLLGKSTFSQQNVFLQFTNALKRLTNKNPVVAFIDDLHWADASSLQLLFHLARYLQDRSVLIICTYRPVEAMETGMNAPCFRDIRANLMRYGANELELKQGIQTAEYITQRYPINLFSSDFVKRIQTLTDGHALFVNQLLSLWEETGVISATPNPEGELVWSSKHNIEVEPVLPHTLSEVLQERTRLMENELRDILTFASVEGEDFTAQVIARLRQLEELQVYDDLEILENRYHFVQEQGTKEVTPVVLDFYRFTHRFFREHIYNQLSSGKRRILHRQVGECLEALYNGQSEIAGQLALHFEKANDPLKAARYALQAAIFEQDRYAWSEGEQWCKFGLNLISGLSSVIETRQLQLDLLERSGYGYYESGDFIQARSGFQEMLVLAQQLQANAERLVGIYIWLADISELEGQLEKCKTYYEQAGQILEEHAVPFGEIHVELNADRAFMQERQGTPQLAIDTYRKILVDAEELPMTPSLKQILATIYNYLGISLTHLGQYSNATDAYRKAIELVNTDSNKRFEAMCWLNMADNCLQMEQLEECETYAANGLNFSHQVGSQDDIAYAQSIQGACFLAQKKYKEAEQRLIEAIALSEEIGSFWNMPNMYADLARVYLMLSDIEEAHQKAEQAVAYAEETSYQLFLGNAIEALAQVEAIRGNTVLAEQHFEKAITILRQVKCPHDEATAQRYWAEMLLQQGEEKRAKELLQAAIAVFKALGLANELAEAQRLLEAN